MKKSATRKTETPKAQTSTLVRQELSELSKASLYAKVYLLNQGLFSPTIKLDESWKDVPILREEKTGEQVTIRILESYSEFWVAVPSFSHSERFKKRTGQNWFIPLEKYSDQPSWIRETLMGLHWNSIYLGTFHGEVRYRFSTKSLPAVEKDAFKALLCEDFFSISRASHRVSAGRFRPVFPAPDDYQLIGFASEHLPKWALADNWLVKRLIVSPIEFQLSRKTPTVSLLNLNEYVSWVFGKRARIGCGDASSYDIKLEIQRFLGLLLSNTEVPFYLDQEGQGANRRQLRLEDIASKLRLPVIA